MPRTYQWRASNHTLHVIRTGERLPDAAEVVGPATLLQAIGEPADDPEVERLLRDHGLAGTRPGSLGLADSRRLVERLQDLLRLHYVVCRVPHQIDLVPLAPPSGGVLGPASAPNSAPDKVHWFAVRIVDTEGNPVVGEDYEIELPDGTKKKGTLDGDGSVRFDGLKTPGTCKVTFPKLKGEPQPLM
jgi:hypothetical protein